MEERLAQSTQRTACVIALRNFRRDSPQATARARFLHALTSNLMNGEVALGVDLNDEQIDELERGRERLTRCR